MVFSLKDLSCSYLSYLIYHSGIRERTVHQQNIVFIIDFTNKHHLNYPVEDPVGH